MNTLNSNWKFQKMEKKKMEICKDRHCREGCAVLAEVAVLMAC